MSLLYDVFETPLGWVGALASTKGLRRTTLPQSSPEECIVLLGDKVNQADQDPGRFQHLNADLQHSLSGQAVGLDEDLDLDDAAPFFKAAWEACLSIPYGHTRTYRWLAIQAGSPLAVRAAGQAMARNRLPLVVPCHRVIGSDGRLCGFGSEARQLDLKQALLNIEAGAVPSPEAA